MTNKLLHYTQRDVFPIKDIATKFNTTIDDVLHIANDKHIVLEYLVKSKRNIILAVPEFYQDKNGMMVESYGEYRSIYLKTGDRMDLSVDAIKQLMANQFFYEGDNMGHSLYNDGFVVANNVDQGEKITIDDLIISKNSIDKLSALLKNDTPEHISKSEASKQEQRELIFFEWLTDKNEHMVSQMKKEEVLAELRKINPHLFMGDQKHFFRLQKRITFKSGRKPGKEE